MELLEAFLWLMNMSSIHLNNIYKPKILTTFKILF